MFSKLRHYVPKPCSYNVTIRLNSSLKDIERSTSLENRVLRIGYFNRPSLFSKRALFKIKRYFHTFLYTRFDVAKYHSIEILFQIFHKCSSQGVSILKLRSLSYYSVFVSISFCCIEATVHTAPFSYKKGGKNIRFCAFTLIRPTSFPGCSYVIRSYAHHEAE